MLKIGFLTTLGVNVGDECIRNGIRAILDALGTDYTPLYINKHDPKSASVPCEDEDISLNDKFFDCNLFVQSGAPVYWNLGPNANSLTCEWHEWVWQKRLFATDDNTGPVFVNLGAGSCQAWTDSAEVFLRDSKCAEFARQAHARARLTTVRDPIAKIILDRLGCKAEALPCPAFLAAARSAQIHTRRNLIGVNFMALGGHYSLDPIFAEEKWIADVTLMIDGLRKLGRLLFIAHDNNEAEFLGRFLQPGERMFLSRGWRDYLEVYGACSLVVANRVHGAVTAAGFGAPAVILGNDTRAQIGDFIGLARFQSGHVNASDVLDTSAELIRRASEERERLLYLRASTISTYCRLLSPILEN